MHQLMVVNCIQMMFKANKIRKKKKTNLNHEMNNTDVLKHLLEYCGIAQNVSVGILR